MRPPSFGNLLELFRSRSFREPFQILERDRECEVPRRPDISPPHSHEQINIGAPRADPLYAGQSQSCFIVRHPREFAETQITIDDGSGQVHEVGRLLARDAESTQMSLTQMSETFRSERINGGFEAKEHRLCRPQRHLLLEDDMYQRLKAGCAPPEWRVAVGGKYSGQCPVAFCEVARGEREGFLGKRLEGSGRNNVSLD